MNANDKAGHISGIYAQVLSELAEQSQIVDAVKDDLDALTNLSVQIRDFKTLMVSPYFSEEHKKQLVHKVFSGRLNELTVNFLMVVIEHDRAIFLPQITTRYNEFWESYHGYCRVKATVARAMSNSETESLTEDIAAAINSKIKLELVVNPSVIGGIAIRYDNKIIDNTVINRLQLAVRQITNRDKINEI